MVAAALTPSGSLVVAVDGGVELDGVAGPNAVAAALAPSGTLVVAVNGGLGLEGVAGLANVVVGSPRVVLACTSTIVRASAPASSHEPTLIGATCVWVYGAQRRTPRTGMRGKQTRDAAAGAVVMLAGDLEDMRVTPTELGTRCFLVDVVWLCRAARSLLAVFGQLVAVATNKTGSADASWWVAPPLIGDLNCRAA